MKDNGEQGRERKSGDLPSHSERESATRPRGSESTAQAALGNAALARRRRQAQGTKPGQQEAPAPAGKETPGRKSQGEVDLSRDTLDPNSFVPDDKGMVMARLPGLAQGEIKLVEKGETYRTPGQGWAIPLQHHPVLGNVIPEKLVLVVAVDGNNISGHLSVGSPGRHSSRGDRGLFNAISKAPEALGWAGLSNISIGETTNTLKNGRLILSGAIDFTISGFVKMSGSFSMQDEEMSLSGEGEVKIPGGSGGNLKAAYTRGKGVSGEASIKVELGKLSGTVAAKLEHGVLLVQGTVGYSGDRLSGSVTLMAVDAATAREIVKMDPEAGQWPAAGGGEGAEGAAGGAPAASQEPGPRAFAGWGELDFSLTEWLTGRTKVVVNDKGDATVKGEIAPPDEIILFEQKDWTKNPVKTEVRAIYGLPVVGNVTVFGNISLEAMATVGPGKLYDIKLSGQYSTVKSVDEQLSLQASLNISAFAGLRLRAEGGAGIEVADHDIKAGVGLWALAGVRGYVDATPTIGYREEGGAEGEFYIKGYMELAAQPFLELGGDLFIEVDSPWWSPLPDKKWKWPLGSLEYPLPGEFGLSANVEHVLGSKQWPEIELSEVGFDSSRFMSDLLREDVPPKSKAGEEKKPALWKDSGATEAPGGGPGGQKAAPAAGKQPPGESKAPKTKKAKAGGEPAGKPPRGGKGPADKGKGLERLPDTLQLPVDMAGAGHTLFIALGQGAQVEIASRRELLSKRIGRATGALIRRQQEAEKTGASDYARRLQEAASDLKALGAKAKRAQKEAEELGIDPKRLPEGKGKKPSALIFKELADDISAYGKKHSVQDLDEILDGRLARQGRKPPRAEEPGGKEEPGRAGVVDIELGETVRFTAGGQPHRIWVDVKGTEATLMVASSPISVSALLAEWRSRLDELSNDPRPDGIKPREQAQLLLPQAERLAHTANTSADALAQQWRSIPTQSAPAGAGGASSPPIPDDSQLESQERQLSRILQQLFALFGGSAATDPIKRFTPELALADAAARPLLRSALTENAAQFQNVESWSAARSKFEENPVTQELIQKPLLKKHDFGRTFHEHAIEQVEQVLDDLNAPTEAQTRERAEKIVTNYKGTLHKGEAPFSRAKAALVEQIFASNRISDTKAHIYRDYKTRLESEVQGLHDKHKPKELEWSEDGTTCTYKGAGGAEFTVSRIDGLIRQVEGKGLRHKRDLDILGRGYTGEASGYVSGRGLASAHLIADQFLGSGYKDALNLITTSAHFNNPVMAGIEKTIRDTWMGYVSELTKASVETSHVTFDLTIKVFWVEVDGPKVIALLMRELGAKLLAHYPHWDRNNLEKEIHDKLQTNLIGASPNLKRVGQIKYTVVFHGPDAPSLPPMTTGPDLWLGFPDVKFG